MTGRVNPDVKYRNNYYNYGNYTEITGCRNLRLVQNLCKKRILASPVSGLAYLAWVLVLKILRRDFANLKERAGGVGSAPALGWHLPEGLLTPIAARGQ